MSRADDLIDRLQAEIVKRDARIVELDDELDTVLSDWGDMRLQLAALKAQQPSAGGVDERAAFACQHCEGSGRIPVTGRGAAFGVTNHCPYCEARP